MATRTKPLITAAAFASAAAIAVASPALAPNFTPTPSALSAAQVDLTSFATLLSLTSEEYVNAYFAGYGYVLSANQPENPDWAADWVGTGCDFSCAVQGVSGVGYMALDALINGNTPTTPADEVKVSAVNYFFEGGASSGAQYLVSAPFANPASPLYNTTIASAIALAFQGAYALTTLYVQALDTISLLAVNGITLPIPTIGGYDATLGQYIYGGIQAYLGPNTSDEFFGDWGYYAGLSGVLNYVLDVITTGGNPFPPYGPPVTTPAASTRSAAALATSVVAATSASADTVSATPASTDSVSATPVAVKAEVASPKAGDTPSAEATPADSTPADSTPAASGSTEAVAEATPADTTPAPAPTDSTPAVDSPSSAVADSAADSTPAATKPADAPAKASKRPVRNAVERATKKIASAIGGAAAKAAPAAGGSADSGASAG
jgi:hypothetical protein